MRLFIAGMRYAFESPYVLVQQHPEAYFLSGYAFGRRLLGVYSASKRR